MRVELISIDEVPDVHRRVFDEVSRWDIWHDRPSANEIASDLTSSHHDVLLAGRWLRDRVFIVTKAYGDAIDYGIRVRRGRWSCVHAIDVTPGLARDGVEIVDMRGTGSTRPQAR